ncbi:MAG: HU family DNA-binding protein [Myxococcales bacterium]|nr:HU family DNA-binding protein [Myxococcales bacterium]
MTKAELIEHVHEVAGEGLSRKLTGEVVDAIFDTLVGSLEGDGKFAIPGFGTFNKKHRAARTGRNPQSGETIEIAASNTVTFKVGAGLKGDL